MANHEFKNYSEFFPAKEKIKGKKQYKSIHFTRTLFSSALVISLASIVGFTTYIQTIPKQEPPIVVVPDDPFQEDPIDEPTFVEPAIQNEQISYDYETNQLTLSFEIIQNDAVSIDRSSFCLEGVNYDIQITDQRYATASIPIQLADGPYEIEISVTYSTIEKTAFLTKTAQLDIQNPEPEDEPTDVWTKPAILSAYATYTESQFYLEGSFIIQKNSAEQITSIEITLIDLTAKNVLEYEYAANKVKFISQQRISDSATILVEVDYIMNGSKGTIQKTIRIQRTIPTEKVAPQIINLSARYDTAIHQFTCSYDILVNDADSIDSAYIYVKNDDALYRYQGTIDSAYHVSYTIDNFYVSDNSIVTTEVTYSMDGQSQLLEETVSYQTFSSATLPTLQVLTAQYQGGKLTIEFRITQNDAQSIDNIELSLPYHNETVEHTIDQATYYDASTDSYRVALDYTSQALQNDQTAYITVSYTLAGNQNQLQQSATIAVTEDYPVTMNIYNDSVSAYIQDDGGVKWLVLFNATIENATITTISIDYQGSDGHSGTLSCPISNLLPDNSGGYTYNYLTTEADFLDSTYTIQMKIEYTDHYGATHSVLLNKQTVVLP